MACTRQQSWKMKNQFLKPTCGARCDTIGRLVVSDVEIAKIKYSSLYEKAGQQTLAGPTGFCAFSNRSEINRLRFASQKCLWSQIVCSSLNRMNFDRLYPPGNRWFARQRHKPYRTSIVVKTLTKRISFAWAIANCVHLFTVCRCSDILSLVTRHLHFVTVFVTGIYNTFYFHHPRPVSERRKDYQNNKKWLRNGFRATFKILKATTAVVPKSTIIY